jgi:phosphatidylethanolamine-binding protein (PEBP) family uncharacterized protein
MMRRRSLALLLTALVVVTSACARDYRTLQPPAPGATAPPRSTTSTIGTPTSTEVSFSVSSSAISPQSRIPADFTCQGAGTSPPISFSGIPKGTKQLVFMVLDNDDNDAVQWLVTGMPSSQLGITKGSPPVGGTQVVAWKPPCPASGTHAYEFELLALPNAPVPGTTADPDTRALVRELQQQASARASFTASFGR